MPLQIIFAAYKNYLYFLHTINIWKSIKNFHFIFHHFRIMRNPTDSAFWTEIDTKMKAINLVRKPMKFDGQFGATAGSPSNPDGQQWDNYSNAADGNPNLQPIRICHQFNNNIECYSDCWYVHICSECKKKEHAKKNCKKKWFINNSEMNIFLSAISESFLYFFTDTSAFFLADHGLLWAEKWKKRLQNHFDKLYINTFYKIIIHETRIDYTDSKQRIINLNLQFIKKISEVLTKDIKNQQTHNRIFCLKSILKYIIISFFELTFKFNNK